MVPIRDKARIVDFLQRDPDLHLYEIGDLDPFFWPHTRWYGLEDDAGQLEAVALLYSATSLPVLLALGRELAPVASLLEAIRPDLTAPFYAHLSPGLVGVLERHFACASHGVHLKMSLADPTRIYDADTSDAPRLEPRGLSEVEEFYRRSYPGNWFDPRMLSTGQYFGIREDGALVSVAGVHVYSPDFGVAALGNIATLPSHRGRGLAGRVTARLCTSLLQTASRIGLNVKADNLGAIACYQRLGFSRVASYEEFMVGGRG
jgi:ribosomal protein S18 acetylase RimI-like enzyme